MRNYILKREREGALGIKKCKVGQLTSMEKQKGDREK
jgi:hypothetical protein